MQTAKHQVMRSMNTTALLQTIHQYGAMSRQLLHERTGLSWGAISNIVSDLLSEGILIELPVEGKHSGRPSADIAINARKYLFGGIDINMQGLSVVITNMVGKALITLYELNIGNTPQEVLEKCADLLNGCLQKMSLSAADLSGIGVSIQGSIDSSRRVSLYSPHLPYWDNVQVCDFFEKRFGISTLLFHDTYAMLQAERMEGRHNAQNMAFIRLSMGFGMALFLNGQSYMDMGGNASEYGHTIIKPNGLRCTCGNCGCLEAYVSGRSLLYQAQEGVARGTYNVELKDGDNWGNITRLAQAARDGHSYERSLFKQMGHYFGIGLVNLTNTLNPEMIIVGGNLAQFSDLYIDEAINVLKMRAWKQNHPRVVLSNLNMDGAAIGAAISTVKFLPDGSLPEAVKRLLETS